MKKILIIEDNIDLAENLELLIREHKFKVVTCLNARDGFKSLVEFKPDLILCDIMLPDISGYKFLAELRKIENKNIPIVIYITARSQREDLRKGMALGADDYITKPFTHEELIKSITVQLKKRELLLKNEIESIGKNISNKSERRIDSSKGKNICLDYNSHFFVDDRNNPGLYLVSDLIMIKSFKDYTRLYFKDDKKCILRKPMTYWEKKLPGKHFVRARKQIIINVNYIEHMEKISSNRLLFKLKQLVENVEVSQRYSKKMKSLYK